MKQLYCWPEDTDRRNFVALFLEGSLFFGAMAFVLPATVIPTVVKELGASRMVISLAPALNTIGWLLPQLLSAGLVERLSVRKPYILRMAGLQRFTYLLIALLFWILAPVSTQYVLAAFLVVYVAGAILDGMTTPAWMDLVARAVPANRRGTLFASRYLCGGLIGLGASVIVEKTLDRFTPPAGFCLVFLYAFIFFALSWITLWRGTIEIPFEKRESRASMTAYFRDLPSVLRADCDFARFLFAFSFYNMGMLCYAFFSVAALERFALPVAYAGRLTLCMTAGQLFATVVCGRFADKYGHRLNLSVSAGLLVLATAMPLLQPPLVMYEFSIFLLGMGMSAGMVSRLTIVMEYAPPDLQPTYAGLANTISAPVALLAPLLGGWLAERYSLQTAFAGGLLAYLMALALLIFLVRDPRQIHRNLGAVPGRQATARDPG